MPAEISPRTVRRMFFNILVGVDGHGGGRDAIALAKQLSTPWEQITLAHACGDDWKPGRDGPLSRLVRHQRSHQLLTRERALAGLDARLYVSIGRPVGRALHALAERRGCDLLVVGASRRGPFGRVVYGDDTRASLNGAPCAVAIAPRGYTGESDLARIGVGYDDSPEAARALDLAHALAEHHDSKVDALPVVSPLSIAYGEPGDELLRFSEQLDLLIVGSRSFGPVDRLFEGSTSNYLARRAHCPLLILPRTAYPSAVLAR